MIFDTLLDTVSPISFIKTSLVPEAIVRTKKFNLRLAALEKQETQAIRENF